MYGKEYKNTYVLELSDLPTLHAWAKSRKWYRHDGQLITLTSDSLHHTRRNDRSRAFTEPETGFKISNMRDHLKPSSRLYIVAYGMAGASYIKHRESRDSEKISIASLAQFLSEILSHPDFKVNLGPNNIVISLIICEAAKSTNNENSLATQLQQQLKSDYGVYVNILARNRQVNIIKIGNRYLKYTTQSDDTLYDKLYIHSAYPQPLMYNHDIHKVPGSKLFFCWGYNDQPIVYSAYSYRDQAKLLDELRSDLLLHLSHLIQPGTRYNNIMKFIDNSDPAQVIDTCLSEADDKKHGQINILNKASVIYKAIRRSGIHYRKHYAFFNTKRREIHFHHLCERAAEALTEFKAHYIHIQRNINQCTFTS